MDTMASFIRGSLLIGILAVQMSVVKSVAYNDLCTADSDCLSTNTNTTCSMESTPTCLQGKCLCSLIFHWVSGDTKCKVKKYYLDRCSASETYCTETTTCTDGQCQCAGSVTFNTILRMCTTLKAVAEDCNTAADCYTAVANAVECAIPTGGTQNKCTCKAGYILEKGACRMPLYGETCTVSVGCYNMFSASDTSLTTETCGSLNTCVCPSTATTEKILQNGKIYKVCLTTPTSGSTLKNVQEVCTQSNECTDKICLSCPEFPTSGGTQEKKCVAQPTYA